MNNNNSKGISYVTGFFMLIGIALLGLFISGRMGMAILSSNGGIDGVKAALTNPANAAIIRLIQTFSLLFSMFIPALIVASILTSKPFQLLGFWSDVRLRQVVLTIAIIFAAMFVAGVLGYLTKELPWTSGQKSYYDQLEKSYAEQVEIMLDFRTAGGYAMSIFLMAFLPAVCEETLFRGGLQNFLTRATKKPWIAIVVVSVIFSLVHFSVYGFLPRIFLGLVLGYIYYLTGNLWLSITAHFFNNAIAVTSAYVLSRQGTEIKEALNQDLPGMYWGLIGLPMIFLFFKALKKSVLTDQLPGPSDHDVKSTHGI